MKIQLNLITLITAARQYSVSQLRIWQLIRQKKLRSWIDRNIQQVVVDKGQLDAYMNKHQRELEIWQQPIKQEKNNESSTIKKSQFDYDKH